MAERKAVDDVRKALDNSEWQWRTVQGISQETELTVPEVRKILEALVKEGEVIQSSVPDAQGRALFALTDNVIGNKEALHGLYSRLLLNITWQRWFVVAMLGLWALILVGVAVTLLRKNIDEIKPETLLFTLLGLLVAPAIFALLPSIQGFKLFGVEFKLREQMVLQEERIRDLIFEFIDPKQLSETGKKALKEWEKKQKEA